MGLQKREFGREGEEEAVRFLRSKGYRILERNFRLPFGEIDIVASEGDFIVFVEVKTRKDAGIAVPQMAVNSRKQRQITKAALGYLQRKRIVDRSCRFDVVAITCGPGGRNFELIKNAFEPARGYFLI